jgi:Gpi18-like mannosyltransferase
VRVPAIKFSKVTLGYMLAIAWVVSIALSPFFRHPSDVPTWKFLGEITFNLRINPLPYTSFYGSCWLFTILSSYPTYLIVSLFRASDLFLNLILKVPIIVGDLIVGVVLFKFTKSKLVTAMWLFNPFVIFVSAIQGQFDVLPTLFVLLATYFLLQRKNLASAVSLAIGIGFKIFPVFLLPFFIIFSLKNLGRKATLKYVIVLVAVVAVLFAPFFLPQNFKYLFE